MVIVLPIRLASTQMGKTLRAVFYVLILWHEDMESKQKFRPDKRLRLMDQVRQVLRYHHYAYRTERAYCDWIVRYINFHGSKIHPQGMGKAEVEAFLSHLATQGKVSASTQRQVLNAIANITRFLGHPRDFLMFVAGRLPNREEPLPEMGVLA